MDQREIYLGDIKAHFEKPVIKGEAVLLNNESFYKISNSNAMRPFFMSIVSDSDHWMFISSNGGLTAGRKNSDSAIFPYYTDDKITESHEITGSKTILQIHKDDKSQLWEPFSERYEGVYAITRNLYKNSYGNKIIFEEINEDLGLTFRYQWNSSDQYGFVKKSTLVNHSKNSVQLTIIDGIQNNAGTGIRILTDDLTETLFSEHLTVLVTGFPDTIGSDGNNMACAQPGLMVFGIGKILINPEGDSFAL